MSVAGLLHRDHRPKRTRGRSAAAVTLGAVMAAGVLGACGGGSSSSTSPAQAAAAKPATSITVWNSVLNNDNWQGALLKGFTKATGIKVNLENFPQASLTTKLSVAQTAHSTAYTLFEDPESETSNYLATQSVAPITSFLASKTLTPASYDASGIPSSEVKQCTVGGVQYCEPNFLDGGPVLYYNKQIFAQAHLTPPTTWAQVETDANMLTTPAHAGVCIRGSIAAPNGYPVLLMLPYFLPYAPNYQGEYLNSDWKPLFDTPQALTWAKEYETLMQKDTPKGVAAFSYTDCVNSLNAGKSAMFWDDSSLEPTVLNPKVSKLADDINVDELHCPSFNQSCLLSAPWGMFINKNVSAADQAAGWKFIEYMTSPSSQLAAFKFQGDDPSVATRPATLQYILKNAAKYGLNESAIAGLDYGSQHIEPNAIPVSAAFNPIQNSLFAVLSEMITGQVDPQKALTSLQSQMITTLKTFGLPKKG